LKDASIVVHVNVVQEYPLQRLEAHYQNMSDIARPRHTVLPSSRGMRLRIPPDFVEKNPQSPCNHSFDSTVVRRIIQASMLQQIPMAHVRPHCIQDMTMLRLFQF
jgi:hypothetical protein